MSPMIKHWRMALHLLFGTRRFGVNDQWRAGFNSIFSKPLFGFGYGILLRPWQWSGMLKVIRLRREIAGWSNR